MALSFVEYTADGVDTQFTVTFNFITRAHVTVTIDGVDDATFTFINDGLIQPTNTPANLEKVRITRTTPTGPTTQTDFEDGSTLVEADLDRVLAQAMYVAEESNDASDLSLSIAGDDATVWDAETQRIKNIKDAVGAQDAVSKSQLDAIVAAAGGVPTPADPGDNNSYLKAGSATFAWTAFLIAHISDAVAVVRTFLGSADKAAMRTNMGVVIGTDVLPEIALISQAAAEAGTATVERTWTAERVKQAIAALEDHPAAALVQVVETQISAEADGTTTMPVDDSIPQKAEGIEFMTLAITPKASGNKLKIMVTVQLSGSGTGAAAAALFVDDADGAIAAMATHENNQAANNSFQITFTHTLSAGSTNARTYKVRCGTHTAQTLTFNGVSAARLMGGVMASSIVIMEHE